MPHAPLDEHTSVSYVVAGEAHDERPDLVLVHGTGGSAATNWAHLIEGLRDGRRAIAPDLAGSGATTDHGGRLELEQLVAQVDGATRHAGSTSYDVVGFSLGAVVAAALAATHPERVRRLVLIAGWTSSADGRTQLQFDLWRRLAGRDPEGLAQLLTLTGFSAGFVGKRPPSVVQKMVRDTLTTMPPGLDRQAELDQRIDISGQLGAIAASTLVIGCRDDAMVPVQHTREMVAQIRWSDYTELDSGHLVLFEQPAALTEIVTRFLARPDRRARDGDPYHGVERREYR